VADLGDEAVADAFELFEFLVKIRVGHVGRHERWPMLPSVHEARRMP
jgi:hypothetical protein